MPGGSAQLSVTEQRMAMRHRVDCAVRAEHLNRGREIELRLRNFSANGVLIDPAPDLQRGDRVILRLPALGRIEAYCIWTFETRAGCQFERVLRPVEFDGVLAAIKPATIPH
ncbi:PilZ domain-containing protein [Croceibacterium ferulae]|uniref:PilZ domain-containing protein n=1 Tax=Croceibacterium ferulae TaxID=1854641 RepID=UPI000EB52974|nr:PilZ domain-containing protein [Croceibacterium ferulae]